MWGQWTGITAAPMPAFVAPLPTTAPPPPPTEPAPQPPHVVASTTLLPPTVAPTSVLPVDFNSAAAGNPYSQYTATQYAAMTPEQQYALQQHWQQWQAYQEEYAKWHAQYGEQYKREMEAAAASNPAYANYYQQQLPAPATVTVPTATATVATTVSKPVSQQPAKITGQPQLYNQPPPAVNLNQLPPSINLNQYNTSQAAPPIAATRTAQQPMEFTQPPPTFNASQPPPPITQENTATLGPNRNFCGNFEGENDNQGYQQNDANNRFSENSRPPQQNNNNNMNNDNRGGGPSRNNRGGSNMGFNDGRDNWNNNRGSGPPPQNFNNRNNNEWNPGTNNYGNVAPNDGNNNNGFQGPPPNWNNSNNNNNNNWGNSGSNDGPYQSRERAVNRPNNDNFQNRERGSNWGKNNNGGKPWGNNNNNNNNFNRQNDNFNGRNNANRGNANNDNNNRSRGSGSNNNNWDNNNNGPMGRSGNNSNNNNWNQRGGNNWGGGVNAQQQRNFGHNNTPNNNPRGGGPDNNQRQPDLDEESFDRQFRQWEEQFEQWKRANANHPDRAMYRRYEQEFEKQRRRIIERREQMRRRKIQIGLSPTQLKNAPPPIASNELCNQDESNTQSSNDQETLQHQQEQEQEQSQQQQHLSNENLTESEKHKEVEKSEEMNPDNHEIERTQLQHQQQQPKQHFQDIASSNTSTPLGGKRKSRFSAMPSKILASDDTTTPNVAKATAVINLDEDDDNKSDAENSSPKITELFRKSDGIPGLDLVEGDNEKTQTTKEGNGANRQQAAAKEKSVGSAQNTKSTTLPDITKSLNDPEFMKKISEAVAKAQGKDCSDNVEQQQQQSTSNENMRLDDDGRPLSFAEWQRRKGAKKGQHHSIVNVERDSTNSNDSNAVRDRVIDLCDRRSNVDQNEDNNDDDDYDEDCSQNEDNDGPNDSGFNRFGVQLDSRDCNYASDNFEPPEPNQFGVNFRGFNGRNFGPNGPGGPNLGGGGPNNFGRNFGPGNWGPHGPGNFGPNGPGNWGPNMPGNWGPHGPGNWRPNGPNGNFGPNFGPGNNFGPNFRQNFPNFGPNGRNFGPNFGPNGPGRNFGRNSPFNRRNFAGGNNRSNFNMDFNGPNGSNFGGGGGSGSGSIGSGDDYNNSNDNSNDASNENKSMQNTNNPFRRQDGPRAPVFDDDAKASRNDTSNKMDDESWLKGPGGGGIGDYTNNDYSGGGGGAYFRHMQVIDYTENAKAPKVIDYGHKPAEVFKPVQTIEYGHASMPQQQQQEPQHQHQSQQESQKILTRQQRINQKKKQRRKIKKTTLTNTNNTYNNNNLSNNNDQNTANNETLQENNAQNQQSNATARTHNQMARNANGNDDDNKQPSNICENKENIMKSHLEEVSDTENLPDSVVDMDLDNGSPAPPPPPTLSSGGHNFLTANYHQTTNSGAPISIFPSTAVANENIPQMSAKHVQMSFPTVENQNTITIDEILFKPGRYSRPKKICIILRGPPGSGKSHVAKLIKEKEKEMDGSNPRILSIDDYFLIENDYEEKCPQTGRKITKKEISYEYDKKMEERYMQYLIKSFKKTITDNLYDFIVVDCNNNSLRTLNEFYCHSKDSGYMPYIIDLFNDLDICLSRNIHKRSASDIKEIINNWKLTPFHYIKLDVSTLLDNVVEMEDAENVAVDEPEVIDITDNNSVCSVSQSEMNVTDTEANKEEDDDSNDEGSANCGFLKSKWETDNTTEKMARLDGTSKLGIKRKPTMEEYLQMDDWQPPTVSAANNGKKRVRWADIEEKRKQEKMRAVGFVVGQTDWKRMMDPNAAKRALNKMKYIEPNKKKR